MKHNPQKTISSDKISPSFLKDVHGKISLIRYPTCCSFKKRSKSKPENYRPIFLICIHIYYYILDLHA